MLDFTDKGEMLSLHDGCLREWKYKKGKRLCTGMLAKHLHNYIILYYIHNCVCTWPVSHIQCI